MPRYRGIDIGGMNNAWKAAIIETGVRITAEVPSLPITLEDPVTECQSEDVLSVAIDAQLKFSISRENGFRLSDDRQRELLPDAFKNRVVSYNSLMAV